jgi:hypothetical protein
MVFTARLLRAFRVPASLTLAGAALLNVAPAQAASPLLTWQQAASVQVLCLVGPRTRADADKLQEEICETVGELAAKGAPLPVRRIAFGDPAVLEPGTLTLLVHASVQSDGGQRLVALDVRPFRPGGDHNAILFGAAPRAVRIPGSGPGGDKLEAALAAALAETLPWRQAR